MEVNREIVIPWWATTSFWLQRSALFLGAWFGCSKKCIHKLQTSLGFGRLAFFCSRASILAMHCNKLSYIVRSTGITMAPFHESKPTSTIHQSSHWSYYTACLASQNAVSEEGHWEKIKATLLGSCCWRVYKPLANTKFNSADQIITRQWNTVVAKKPFYIITCHL